MSRIFTMAHPLPPELLDGIACFIDTRRDVIAFALACRTFYKIACPRHSEYRTLRASYADVGVWKHLCERLDLAAGVRIVHILEQVHVQDVESQMSSRPCTPRVCRAGAAPIPYTTKGDALGAIANALGSMPLVESFTWSFPLVLRHESCRLGAAAVWAAAAKLPRLRNLVIVQPLNPPGQYPVYTGGIERYPLWSIGGLSSISLINVAFLRHADSVAMFARVLEQSPALETLHVVLYDWDFNFARFLGKATLRRLRKINLELYMDEEYNAEVLAALFERIPSLEDVEWQYTPIRTLAPGSLPRLKRLVSAYDLGVPELLADKSLPPRRLEMLGGFQLHPGCLAQLAFIDKHALTRLELTRFDSMDLLVEVVRALPALRWLRVPSVDYMRDWRRATRELIPLGEWAHVLACAQQLEVFHGPPFFKDPGLDREYNDARAREIADFAPALRRVDHWTMAPDRAVLIERDGQWREVVVVDD